jgi:hypothetical protein
VSVYRFISAEKARTPVSACCELLGVSRSGYYEWLRRPPAAERPRAVRCVAAGSHQGHPRRQSRRLRRAAHPRRVAPGGGHPGRAQARGAIDAPSRHLRPGGQETRAHDVRVPGVRVADDLVERDFTPAAPNVLLGHLARIVASAQDTNGIAGTARRPCRVAAPVGGWTFRRLTAVRNFCTGADGEGRAAPMGVRCATTRACDEMARCTSFVPKVETVGIEPTSAIA